jgi:hypothetical protein
MREFDKKRKVKNETIRLTSCDENGVGLEIKAPPASRLREFEVWQGLYRLVVKVFWTL